jgi:sugar O-acyltransferase (sialic acid O-acetyltransferase NeuD family)
MISNLPAKPARRSYDTVMLSADTSPGAQRLVIFGIGDFAQVAQAYLARDSRFEVVAFSVHQRHLTEPTLNGLDVVAFEGLLHRYPPAEYAMLVAVGYSRLNRARGEVYQACKTLGYQLITYVDPTVSRVGSSSIGDNCFVFEQNVIQPFVTIGNNVVLWSGNHIGHHTTIGDNCFIASHAVVSGRVTIGANTFIGVNATIRDGVTIAPNCIIGAGAVILRDTDEAEVYRAAGTAASPHASQRWRL